uniref:Mitochondrial pyruvate carrier n=1 Tax=Oryza meridionalis TaxID=40149 RepID=A0A0E0EKL2_9ORYZ
MISIISGNDPTAPAQQHSCNHPLVADVSRRNGQWVWRSIGDRARYPSRIPIPNSLLPNPNLPFIGSCRRRRTRRREAPAAYPPLRLSGSLPVHFWAPTFKWGISIANVADFAKPPEKISYPQQVAVACTGVIWSRYSMVITPKNWNLFSVNVAMAGTGLYQLSRKIRKDYFSDQKDDVASLEG